MSNTIFARPEHFGDVQKTLAEIDRLEKNQYTVLDPGHPVYLEPVDIWVRPASDFTDPDSVRAEIGSDFALSRFVELWHIETGKHTWMSDLPAGYVDERLAELPLAQRDNYYKPNAVTRIGDYLMVGLGQWYCVGERVVDGEPAFEFVSPAERMRRDEAEKAKFVPLVELHKPSWAHSTTVNFIDEEEDTVDVIFETEEFVSPECEWPASVRVTAWAKFFTSGELIVTEPAKASIDVPEQQYINERITPRDMRHIGNALFQVAVALEDALESEQEAAQAVPVSGKGGE